MITNDDRNFTDEIITPGFTEEIVGTNGGDSIHEPGILSEPTPGWTEEIEEK